MLFSFTVNERRHHEPLTLFALESDLNLAAVPKEHSAQTEGELTSAALFQCGNGCIYHT